MNKVLNISERAYVDLSLNSIDTESMVLSGLPMQSSDQEAPIWWECFIYHGTGHDKKASLFYIVFFFIFGDIFFYPQCEVIYIATLIL